MDDLEKELKVGFLDEASQLLADTEQCFLGLESSPDDSSLIEKIFRLAHNLKGSARAVGFLEVGEFTHQLESLLLKLKNKELPIRTETVTLLLLCNDHLREWMDALKQDLDAKRDSSDLMTQIQDQLSGKVVEVAPADEVPDEDDKVVASDLTPSEAEFVAYPRADAFPEEEGEVSPASLEVVATQSLASPEAPIASPVAPQPEPESGNKASSSTSNGPPQQQDEPIRVSSRRLERLMNNVGELVILQTVLNQQKVHIQSVLVQKTISQLGKITKDIQDISMSLRMIPVKATFQKLQRIVRDTSKALGKDIQLIISGEETELDKTVVDHLGDPLVHMIRNAVDHGVEMPEDRIKAGKPPGGTVRLSAFHEGGQIVIEIRDDGKGLNAEVLKRKAVEKGILRAGQAISDKEAYRLIFAPGFSTAANVTDISGRGVGMDVVKTNIEKILQGEVQLETELGKGTRFKILLPLTLAIIDGMVVTTETERYIIPIAQVHESLQPKQNDVHFVSGMGEVLNLRGESLPLYRLTGLLGRTIPKPKASHECIAIVVRSGPMAFAVSVDDIVGQQQVVIKQLGQEIRGLKGFTGGAILGDGRAALILDLNEMASGNQKKGPAMKPTRGVA